MANRSFYQSQFTIEREVVTLYAKLTMASGAPVLDEDESIGITSVSLPAAGRLLFTLADSYNAVMEIAAIVVSPASNTAIRQVVERSSDPTTAQTITLSTLATGGAETTIANGDGLKVAFVLRNTLPLGSNQ